jgi:hypothetical protein
MAELVLREMSGAFDDAIVTPCEVVAECSNSVMGTRFHGTHRDAKPTSCLGHRVIVVVQRHYNGTMRGAQSPQRLPYDVPGQDWLQVRFVSGLRLKDGSVDLLRSASLRPPAVDDYTASHSVQPGTDTARVVQQCVQMTPQAQESLLDDVFSTLSISRQRQDQPHDRWAVFLIETPHFKVIRVRGLLLSGIRRPHDFRDPF